MTNAEFQRKRQYPIVEVTWEDAASWDAWERVDDAKGWVNRGHIVRSVGHLFERNAKRLVLIAGVTSTGSVTGQFKIPMGMVQRIRVLARPGSQ